MTRRLPIAKTDAKGTGNQLFLRKWSEEVATHATEISPEEEGEGRGVGRLR